jgi:N-acetylmuramoyl-L-alanine amidase
MNSVRLRRVIWMSFLALVAVINFSFLEASQKIKVIVDPGHGGMDRGAKFQHLNEADIVLKISEHLAQAINKLPNAKAVRTRTHDYFVPLKQRVEFAKAQDGELFLSIHANAVHPSAKNNGREKHATGAEFYFLNPAELDADDFVGMLNHHFQLEASEADKESDAESSDSSELSSHPAEIRAIVRDLIQQLNIKRSSVLAKTIDEHWSGPRRKRSQSIRQAPFYVLKKSSIPAVLVEVGFIDNPEEAKKLNDPGFQKKIAQGIATGLKDFIQKDSPMLSSAN